MRIARLALALATLFALCGCALRPSPGGGALYERARRASVFVLKDGRHTGSGFFASPDGLVVTCAHMVKGKAGDIEVVSPVAGRLEAQRVAMDFGHDIALLRVEGGRAPFPSLPVAEHVPPPASEVFLFGDPVFRHRLLLTGFVSVARPTYDYNPGTACYCRCFYVAGTSPEGTSGGCWVDRRGRVVGVQVGFLNGPKAPAVIAMVAPADAVRRLLAARSSPAVSKIRCTAGGLVPASSFWLSVQLRRIASVKPSKSSRWMASWQKTEAAAMASIVSRRVWELRKIPRTISPRILCATRVMPV